MSATPPYQARQDAKTKLWHFHHADGRKSEGYHGRFTCLTQAANAERKKKWQDEGMMKTPGAAAEAEENEPALRD